MQGTTPADNLGTDPFDRLSEVDPASANDIAAIVEQVVLEWHADRIDALTARVNELEAGRDQDEAFLFEHAWAAILDGNGGDTE